MHPVTASRSTTWAWRPCPRTSRAAPACACTPPPCAAATVSARSKDCQEGLTRDVANASPSPASSPQSPSRPHSRRRGARTEAWTKSKQTRVRPAAPAPAPASVHPACHPRACQTLRVLRLCSRRPSLDPTRCGASARVPSLDPTTTECGIGLMVCAEVRLPNRKFCLQARGGTLRHGGGWVVGERSNKTTIKYYLIYILHIFRVVSIPIHSNKDPFRERALPQKTGLALR